MNDENNSYSVKMDYNFRKKVQNRLKKARKIKEENDQGYIEYKWKLCDFQINHNLRMDRLTTQLKFRLYEGNGKAIYNLGYSDNGEPTGIIYESMLTSLKNLHMICDDIGANLKNYRVFQGISGYCANVYIETSDNFKEEIDF